MASLSREEKLRLDDLQQGYDEDIGGYCSLGGGERADSPPVAGGGVRLQGSASGGTEREKRIRREIANSNERRRMQSINAGFQSLRTLLPHHEGEKLSKAAILQQTAEYIYQLEQEKTGLLSQNCQLKRLLNQHEGETTTANKKRKREGLMVTVSKPIIEDEASEILAASQPNITSKMEVAEAVPGSANDLIDVRVQLDRERRLRMVLEEQVRALEQQLYPEKIREITHQVQLQYQHHDEDDSVDHGMMTSMRRDLTGVTSETASAVANLQVVSASALQPVAHTETVIATVTNSPPPSPPAPSRLPSILEAAIKAEPKVEVERLPSPPSVSPIEDRHPQARVYLASTSRQNLETIVEAIRHLEGDNLFADAAEPSAAMNDPLSPVGDEDEDMSDPNGIIAEPQDAPLALTTSNKSVAEKPQHLIKVNMNHYLQFHQNNQHRPGVIVVKQNT